jgi:hypothetical protein
MRYLIDDADRELVNQYHWNIFQPNDSKTFYAHGYLKNVKYRDQKLVLLHRLILGAGPGDPDVDHRNRNGLDCRRKNLRFITSAGNTRNTEVRKDNKLGIKGIRQLESGRYQMRFTINGKVTSKMFDSLEEAGVSFDKMNDEQIKKEIL